MDSDDWLPDRGLETSARYLAQIQGDGRFAGVAGLRDADESHMLWIRGTFEDGLTEEGKRQLSKEYVDATSDDYRYRYGIPGDRAGIVRTDHVQKHPFPVFAGERFMSEGVLWQRLSDGSYLFREVSQITYCGDCLPDGLLHNASSVYRKSPRGTACTKNDMPSSKKPLGTKPRDAVSYIRYGRAAGMRVDRLISICRKRLLFLLALPVALAFPVKKEEVSPPRRFAAARRRAG